MTNPDNEPLISGHEYDGIRELDNPLPGWWLFTFIGTIVFALVYWFQYQVIGSAPNMDQELKADLAAVEAKQQAGSALPTSSAAGGAGGESDVAALLGDPATLTAGKSVFVARCVACHGPEGKGQIGPDLTDSVWIHGQGAYADILKAVQEGILPKGMPPWKGTIPDNQVAQVSAFVYSLSHGNIAPAAK